MFWNAEKIEDAHRIGRFLGPWGRMLNEVDGVLTNISLYTIEHGKIWYGDINLNTDKNTLKNIAMTLKQTIYILPDSPKEGYKRPMHESALSVIEIE